MKEKENAQTGGTKSVLAKNNLLISLSALAMAVQNLLFQRLYFHVWAVFGFPIAFAVTAVLFAVLLVKFIRAKSAVLVCIYAVMLIFEVSLCKNIIRCVRDISGGTEQLETQYFWIEESSLSLGNEIRLYDDEGKEYHLGCPKKEDYSKYEVWSADDLLTIEDLLDVRGRIYMAKISYYPNNRTVKDIEFVKREGVREWDRSPES